MSLGVALQSVLYYVVACSACHKCAYRRKMKKQAARSKKEKSEIAEEGLYQHPSPFSTNIYWREEMTLGPGPPQKKNNNSNNCANNRNQRALTAGTTSTNTSSTATANEKASGSALDVHTLPTDQQSDDSSWNRRRYQREDELLWGHHVPAMAMTPGFQNDRGAGGGSSIGVVGLRRQETQDDYYTAKNPPVNDLHPPVVSTKPARPNELQWMLQPPPSANVMSGKERANRSRSDSGASVQGDDLSLGKQVGERLLEQQIRNNEGRSTPELSLMRKATRSKASNSALSSTSNFHEPASNDPMNPRASNDNFSRTSSRGRKKRSPSKLSENVADDGQPSHTSNTTSVELPAPPQRAKLAERPVRPRLATVISNESAIPKVDRKRGPPERPVSSLSRSISADPESTKSRRPLVQRAPDSASSLQVLQELVSTNATKHPNNTKFDSISIITDTPPLPPPSPSENKDLLTSFTTWQLNVTRARQGEDFSHEAQLYQHWYEAFGGDYKPPHRWSMDI